MVTTVEISGWVEEVLEYMVRAGIYNSKAEAVRDAVRRMIGSVDLREVAFRAYRDGGITYPLAVEISRAGYEELLAYFIRRGLVPELGVSDIEEAEEGAKSIALAEGVILDPSSIYTLFYTRVLPNIGNLGLTMYVPRSAAYEIKLAEMRASLIHKSVTRIKGVNVLEPAVRANEHARRHGMTLAEAEALLHASRKGGLLVISDDMRTRVSARLLSVPTAPVLSLLVYGLKIHAIDERVYRSCVERMRLMPILVPEEAENIGAYR